jgi:hypothetical protein
MVKGKLIRCYYRAVGNKLLNDTLTVEFEVDGERYTHKLPNKNWAYTVPALQFMGYAGIRPSEFDGSQYIFEEDIAAPLMIENGEYYIDNSALQLGMNQLDRESWFDPDGDVWNSGENKAFGGMSVEPGTGNRAGVPVDDEK